MSRLAELILISRRRSRLSQEDLGDKVGANRASVSLWERGERTPSLGNFAAMAKIFGWTPAEIHEVLMSLDGESDDSV